MNFVLSIFEEFAKRNDIQKLLNHVNVVAKWFIEGFQKSFSGNWEKGKLTREELDLIETIQSLGKFR